ncbi:MAG: phage major capsid protein [Pseudomonadota bacterium]
MKSFVREAVIDSRRSSESTYPVTLSTETPVWRGYGYEVLDHSAVDLSRAPLPVIESHDTGKLNIGIVEGLRLEGKKLKGSLRLGNSARAKEIAPDIESGIVRNVSIGYQLRNERQDGEHQGAPVFRFDFMPTELSLVAAPADINSGIFRTEGTNMETQENEHQTRSQRRRASAGVEEERQRVSTILAQARHHEIDQSIAQEFIDDGTDISEFNLYVLDEIGRKNKRALEQANRNRSEDWGPNGVLAPQGGNWGDVGGREAESDYFKRQVGREFSICRAITALADPKQSEIAAAEFEVSRDYAKQHGIQPRGLYVPHEFLGVPGQRALTSGGSAGNLIATNLLPESFIDMLRARSVVMDAGAQMLNGLVGDVDIGRQTGSATSAWLTLDGTSSITPSDQNFDKVSLTPNDLAAATTISRRALIQSTPAIEMLVRDDLAKLLATTLDATALTGDGTGSTPTGVTSQVGVNTVTLAAAGQPTWDEVVDFETQVEVDNAGSTRCSYVVNPTVAAHMKTTEKASGTAQFIWGGGAEPGVGIVNTYSARSTNNAGTNGIIFGDFSQMMLGFWSGLELDVDKYSDFLKGSVTVRAIQTVDIAIRQPGAFSIPA